MLFQKEKYNPKHLAWHSAVPPTTHYPPCPASDMTLEEAIDHLKEMLNDHDFGCTECRAEHKQYLTWLEELRERRSDQTQSKITRPEPWKCGVCTG